MNNTIDLHEIQFSRLSLGDSFGKVFTWKGRLFRGIYPDAVVATQELFSSGLPDALYKANLIPRSVITDHQADGFGLVIEHELIPHVSYPHEWSFTMLKDAGACVLAVNEMALQFGYETKDCHAYNIIFSQNKPVFVDLGSFVKTDTTNVNLLCYEEFLMEYTHPLKIWKKDYYTARRIIADETGLLPHLSYYKIQYGFPWNKLFYYADKARKGLFRLRNSNRNQPLLKTDPTKRKQRQIRQLASSINGLSSPAKKSAWHNYHNEYLDSSGNVAQSTKRFDRIAAYIKDHPVSTITELAGNQGVTSKIILERVPSVTNIICTDYDENAIDQLYVSLKASGTKYKIAPVVLNFMTPVPNYFGSAPVQRFKSDCVMALAITHHLLLTQGFHIDTVLSTIRSYTSRYAVIEFMPKGLWDGKSAPPMPAWYTKEWFIQHLRQQFDIISEEQTEENRITYFCAIPGTSNT